MNRKLVVHMGRMLIGYTAAGLVAAFVFALTDFIQNPERLNEPLKHFQRFDTVALSLLVLAFPVWLISVIACEFNNARQLRWYALAGAIAALLPLLLFGVLFTMLAHAPWFLPSLIMIGTAGGATYWAIAGRKAGSWKEAAP